MAVDRAVKTTIYAVMVLSCKAGHIELQRGRRGISLWAGQQSRRRPLADPAVNGKTHIIFNFHNGSRETVLLEEDNGKTMLNGSRYFVVKNDRCR